MAEPTIRNDKEREIASYVALLLLMSPTQVGNWQWWLTNNPSQAWFHDRVRNSGIPGAVQRIALESHDSFTGSLDIPGSNRFGLDLSRRISEEYTRDLSKRLFARTQKWRGDVQGAFDRGVVLPDGRVDASQLPEIYPDYQIQGEASDIVTDVWSSTEVEASGHYGSTAGVRTIAYWVTEPGACPICRPLHMTGPEVWMKQFPRGPKVHPWCNCYLYWSRLLD